MERVDNLSVYPHMHLFLAIYWSFPWGVYATRLYSDGSSGTTQARHVHRHYAEITTFSPCQKPSQDNYGEKKKDLT